MWCFLDRPILRAHSESRNSCPATAIPIHTWIWITTKEFRACSTDFMWLWTMCRFSSAAATRCFEIPQTLEIAECLGFNEDHRCDSRARRGDHRRRASRTGVGRLRGFGGIGCSRPGIECSGRAGRLQFEESKTIWDFQQASRDRNWRRGQSLRPRSLVLKMIVAKVARQLLCDRKPFAIETDDGSRVSARAIVIASGARYRRLPIENLSKYEGAGVYYGATFVEAQMCGGDEVIVVGGGNSAGQAALFLAETQGGCIFSIRVDGLEDSMSRYLIRRIEENPAIDFRPHTEIVASRRGRSSGKRSLARTIKPMQLRHTASATCFSMAGAMPNTPWLKGMYGARREGFYQNRPGFSAEDLAEAKWPLRRPPHLLETSLPECSPSEMFALGI